MTKNGWEYEGDPKHILRLLDIFGMQDAKIVTSPGIKEQVLESDEKLLNKEDHRLYRTGVGILLYAASDRSDLKYAVKELMRDVSAPTELSMRRLRRIIRYASGARRLVNTIDWQTVGTTVEAIVDADHAGCLTSRKSTSGGSIRVNKAYIFDYSVTQSAVALSSGESEFLAMVAGILKLLYVANIMRTMGFKVDHLKIYSDSSAARGIIGRLGVGKKVKHICTKSLLVQNLIDEGIVTVLSVPHVDQRG